MAGHIATPCKALVSSYAPPNAKFGDLERWPSSAKNRHEKNLGKATWRHELTIDDKHREISNLFLPPSGLTQWLFQGTQAESKLQAAHNGKAKSR